ncbi:riboflavin synthase [bacterium]|nr:riboflavin synthase [bacterium]
MFTGLVETVSQVKDITKTSKGAKIAFSACFDDTKIGDSIMVNGVCLSVTSISNSVFEADIMNETLSKINLSSLKKGCYINLERALKASSRLDGHIVSGHIDEIAYVREITQDGFSKRITFKCNSDLIVKKGSISVNGVSLTVSKELNDGFEVSLIPETLNNTNLAYLKIGDIVNIEYDILAKYIKKFTQEKKEITYDFLKENGFT